MLKLIFLIFFLTSCQKYNIVYRLVPPTPMDSQIINEYPPYFYK